MLELILGGARSGKSALAIERARASGRPVLFIATATAVDEEMRERIERHRRDRPADWAVLEAPLSLGAALQSAPAGVFVIVDCLTLWLANALFPNHALDERSFRLEREALLSAVQAFSGDAALVSNEVGLGIVPDNAAARRFRDEQGRLNQELAAMCHKVTLVAAGLSLTLKG